MDAMNFDNTLNYSNAGALHIGITSPDDLEKLQLMKNFFERAGISYVEEEDIIRRMWCKFMLNVSSAH